MFVLVKNKIATVNVLYSLKFQRLFNFFKLKFIHIEPKHVCFAVLFLHLPQCDILQSHEIVLWG